MSILDLFCSVDEFWQQFAPQWERDLVASGQRRRRRATRLHPSEIMTIAILFQQSGYRTFKAFYTQHVQVSLRGEFPQLVSYNRFVELAPRVLVPLLSYPAQQTRAAPTGAVPRRHTWRSASASIVIEISLPSSTPPLSRSRSVNNPNALRLACAVAWTPTRMFPIGSSTMPVNSPKRGTASVTAPIVNIPVTVQRPSNSGVTLAPR
jgi:hypothetical protein